MLTTPNRVKKTCKYCGGIHNEKFVCPMKPKKFYKTKDTEAFKFRCTAKWQRKRDEIQRRDDFMCVYCRAIDHRLNLRNTSVHHIIPLEQDFSRRLDDSNLITLCDIHHKQAERGEISVEQLIELLPPPIFGE